MLFPDHFPAPQHNQFWLEMKTNYNEGPRTVFGSQWAWDDCWLMLSLIGKWPGTEGKGEDSCLKFWPAAGPRGQRSRGDKGDFLRLPGECQLASQPGCCASSGMGHEGRLAEEPCLGRPPQPTLYIYWSWSCALSPPGNQDPISQGGTPVPPQWPYSICLRASSFIPILNLSSPESPSVEKPEKPQVSLFLRIPV